jgi:hypothetical protein
VQTVSVTGRLEENVFAPQLQAASRLWIVWLRFIFFSYPIFFFFFFSISRSIFSQLRMTQRQCGSPLSLSSLAGTLSSSFPTYIFPVCLCPFSRPCEEQRLPLDATYARTYRHFTVKPSAIFPVGGKRKVNKPATSQSARIVQRKHSHLMRRTFENRNVLLQRGISVNCLARRRIAKCGGCERTIETETRGSVGDRGAGHPHRAACREFRSREHRREIPSNRVACIVSEEIAGSSRPLSADFRRTNLP